MRLDGLGGPNSVPRDLKGNDRRKQPASEFPAFDRARAPGFVCKRSPRDTGNSWGPGYRVESERRRFAGTRPLSVDSPLTYDLELSWRKGPVQVSG